MKTLIIYSSETGNTKLVCEKAFEYIYKWGKADYSR